MPRLHPDMRVLEVGCGPGAIARRVAKKIAPGERTVDREANYLETARQFATLNGITNMRLQLGDASRLDELDLGGSFDGAYCRFLLEHTPDPVTVVRQMSAHVKNGWCNTSMVPRRSSTKHEGASSRARLSKSRI